MKLGKIRSSLLAVASILALLLGQSGALASAATPSKSPTLPTGNGNGLKISPLRSNITINPGASATVPVIVTNITNAASILKPIENDFIAGDEKGTPALILDPNSYAPSHSLKRFMVGLPNVTVGAGQSQTVNVTITVPKTAQAGGYFGALRFAPNSLTGPSGSGAAVGESVASLILLTVPGPTVERLTLTNFDVQQNGGTSSNFRTPNGLGIEVRFRNQGNLQEAPFGQIYVMKGKKVVFTNNFNQNQPQDQILPDSYRRWLVPLKNLGKFGKYTIGATFTYGAKGQSIEITKTIWIIPTTYILLAVGSLVLLVAIIGGSYLFLRSYKRKILRSSRRRY